MGGKLKVIVFGGQGFIGKQVMGLLKEKDYNSISISRKDGIDLTKIDDVKNCLEEQKPDVIINCAAHVGSLHYVTEYAGDVIFDNVQMVLNMYKAVSMICPNVKIINPISNCSYPGKSEIQREEEFWDGPVHQSVWSYGNSRRAIVFISKCYKMQYNIKSVNFFAPNSYGPGDYTDPNKTHALNGMIIRMLTSNKKGDNEFEIWGTGKPKREWIYGMDLAKFLVDAINIDEQVEPINLAQNISYSIAETGIMIKEAIDFEGDIIFNTKYQDGAPIKQMDATTFKKKYDNFKFTPIKEGIKKTVEYYQKALEE